MPSYQNTDALEPLSCHENCVNHLDIGVYVRPSVPHTHTRVSVCRGQWHGAPGLAAVQHTLQVAARHDLCVPDLHIPVFRLPNARDNGHVRADWTQVTPNGTGL